MEVVRNTEPSCCCCSPRGRGWLDLSMRVKLSYSCYCCCCVNIAIITHITVYQYYNDKNSAITILVFFIFTAHCLRAVNLYTWIFMTC